MVLLVVFPVDIVQVAGQFCPAQYGEEWGESLWQDSPVRVDSAYGCTYSCLVPPHAAKSAWYRLIRQVKMHVWRQVGEMVGAFCISQNVKLCDLRHLHQSTGQPHGYIKDAYGFGGRKTLVSEGYQQFHVTVRTLAYFRRAVKFFRLCACGGVLYLI